MDEVERHWKLQNIDFKIQRTPRGTHSSTSRRTSNKYLFTFLTVLGTKYDTSRRLAKHTDELTKCTSRFEVCYFTEPMLIDLTDYSLLPNGLVFVQNTYSSFLRSTTEYNFVIGSKINKKQFRVGEY